MGLTRKLLLTLSWLCLLFYASCTKILDDELPEKEPKLVINGLLNHDSSLQINISKTLHIFDNENTTLPFISGAFAQFYQNGQFLFNLEENENGYYSKMDFYPSINQTYKVKVEKLGFETVEAETKIPSPAAIQSFDTLGFTEIGEFYDNLAMRCILKYQDMPGAESFYRLDCYQRYINQQGEEVVYRQPVYVDENDEYLYDRTYGYLLWRDLFSDGNVVGINFRIYFDFYYYDPNFLNFDTTTITYTVILSSISEDYYRYDKTRFLYYESGGSDNPFAEPVLIYSNIRNGYGIFGGFSTDTVSFQYSFINQY